MTQRTPRALFLAAATGLTLFAAPLEAGDKYAIKAGTVMTLAGEPIQDGVIVVESGRVTAVGASADVQIPWDAEVLDVPNMVAMPGFVEACSSNGMDRSNETIDVAPFLDVNDSVDPVNFYFENCLRTGVTTINVQQGDDTVIAGQGMIVKPWGMTVERMQVRPQAGLKISITPKRGKSRATQAMLLREAFGDLRRHLEELVQQKKEGDDTARREALAQGRDLEGENAKGRAMTGTGWTVAGLERVPRGEIEEKFAPLLAVVEGRIPVYLNCQSPGDVLAGLAFAKEHGFLAHTTLLIGEDCWKVADAIKAAGVSVILPGQLTHTETDPVTEEETETFLPKVFADLGIPYALQSRDSSSQSLGFQAAMSIAGGMTREQALASVTTEPAKLLGLEGRVGSLQVGADADVVLYSGDPLSVTSFVEYVLVNGELVYDRSKDVRVKYLLEGVEQPGTTFDEANHPTDVHAEEAKAGKNGDDDK